MSLLALAMAVCLQWVTPGGRLTFYAPLRAQGGGERVQVVAALVDDVAKRVGVAPERLGALLIAENSSLDPLAKSWTGTSESLAMLRVGGPHHVAWTNACAAVPSYCEWASVFIAGRVLRDALDKSGGRFARAILIYRFGARGARGVKPRKRDLAVVRMAARIRELVRAETHDVGDDS